MASLHRGSLLIMFVAAAAAGFLMSCSAVAPPGGGEWALTNVAVVDLQSGRVLPDQTVIVRGDRIASVAPGSLARVGRDVRRIDGRGKYLIPGLWDMHAHLWDHEATPSLFLANGITGIRDMGSETEASVALRDAVRQGRRVGPRIVTSGLTLDGVREEPAPHRLTLATVGDAAAAVQSLKSAGVDFLKVYHFLTRDVYLEVAKEAKKHGLPVAGHLPPGVTIDDAVAAGQASIEHLYGMREQISRGEDAAVDEAARKSAAAGVWHTPTLAHYRSVAFRDAPDSPYQPDRHARYLTPEMRQFWQTHMPARAVSAEQIAQRAAAFARFQKAVQRMHTLGVRLLAGSDNGVKYVYPGFGLHDELGELVAAGLSPLDALRMATTNAASYLGLEASHGAIRPGMTADLVLLDANPLEDIRGARQIRGVVANGNYLDRAALDAMLEGVASR
jgi:imidazolonepropionase-like amidohydrolase